MAIWSKDPRIGALIQDLKQPAPLPEQARRYHHLRQLLLDDLTAFNKSMFPFPGRAREMQRLLRRKDNLVTLEKDLNTLLEEAHRTRQEVETLSRQALSLGAGGDPVRSRCQAWLTNLAQMGDNVGRSSEVLQDRASLKQMGEQVRLHAEVLRLNQETSRFLARLPAGDQREALSGELESQTRRLQQGRLDWTWLDQASRALADQRAAASAPVPPPIVPPTPGGLASEGEDTAGGGPAPSPSGVVETPSAPPLSEEGDFDHSAVDLLEEARLWSRELGIGSQPMQRIRERFGIPPVSWDAWDRPEAEKYRQAVQAMLADLRRQAEDLRRERHAELDELVVRYGEIRGPSAELEEEMRRLDMSVETPGRHARWLEVADEVLSRFKGVAGVHRQQLKKSVEDQAEELTRELDEFAAQPLFAEDGQALPGFRERLRTLADSNDLEQILHAISEVGRLKHEFEALRRSFEERSDQLLDRCRDLGQDYASLVEAALRAGMDAPSTSHALDSICQAAEGESRDDIEKRVEEASRQLAAERTRLTRSCREQVLDHGRLCREVAEALDGLPVPLPALPAEQPEDVAELDALLDLLDRHRKVLEDSRSALRGAFEDLEERRCKIRDDLLRLPGEDPYGKGRLSGHLERLFDSEPWEFEADSVELLGELRAVVSQGETFRESFYRDQRQAERLRDELPRRLTRFEGSGLQAYAPRLVYDRVTALIEGAPATARDWASVLVQLREAEDLLGRLERHARRLSTQSQGRGADPSTEPRETS